MKCHPLPALRSILPLLLAAGLIGALHRPAAADDPVRKPAAKGAADNPFPGRFPAPSLDGGVEWLNVSAPVDLRDLRGKVVVLDFWTYCCINCMHILPDLKFLEEKYPNELVVIGVHAPKFQNEKETENIREAILRYEISHPVVNDADMVIARKYAFNSWPTLVVIDPEGNFVGRTSGEGQRELLDHVVSKLVTMHRNKGTLDETPLTFDLERTHQDPTPLRFPGKIVADEAGGRLFISDSNHNRIVIAGLDGKLLDVVGNGGIGRTDGAYDVAQFDHPQGMVLVGETLYVADTENHLLREIDLQAKTVRTLAGTGEQARLRSHGGNLKTAALNSPWDITHLDGTLFIAMAGPHQLWRHKLGGPGIAVFAGSGREDIIDGALDACALAQPSGITNDGTNFYVVDSEGSAVRRVTSGIGGSVTTVVGAHDLPQGASLFAFDDIDGVGDQARLQHPIGILYRQGLLYVADTYNHKIKIVDPQTRQCQTWLGSGKRGNTLDPVQFNEPAGLAAAGQTLYIADTNNHRLLTVNLETKQAQELTIAGLTPPNPPRPTSDDSAGVEATPVAARTVRNGQPLAVTLAFQLPEGFKLNPLAKVVWKLDAVGEQALIAADALGQRQEAEQDAAAARFEIPLAGAGAGVYDLSLNYQYCREGAGGVCKLGRAKFRLNLTAAPDGDGAPLSLSVQP